MTKTFDAPMVRADAMRPCDACGGTGWSKPCGCNSDGRGEGMARAHYHLCRVCGGTNRFPVRMPAADAMADAETLRSIADRSLPGLFVAEEAAAWAIHWTQTQDRTGYRPPRPAGHDDKAFCAAMRAARAAFRAVPGLRGE